MIFLDDGISQKHTLIRKTLKQLIETTVARFKKKKEDLSDRLTEAENFLKETENKHQKSKIKIPSLKEKIVIYKQEINNLKKKISVNFNTIETINELNRFVNNTVQKLEVDIDDYSKKILELRKEIDDIKLQNNCLRNENDELKADNEELQHKLKVALEKISNMEKTKSSTSTYSPKSSLVLQAEQLDGPGNMHKYCFMGLNVNSLNIF